MIWVTGDTHGMHDFDKLKYFGWREEGFTRDDHVIVAGDFGAVWWRGSLDEDLKPYEQLPFTVLFVDGNHENFDLLDSFPVSMWHGGKVQMIRPNIIHLMRGQVYVLEGKKIFTFGGATSTDRAMRVAGLTWWPREMPSHEELDEAIANLAAHGNSVDYIITHSCGERALMYPPLRTHSFQPGRYPENQMLAYFEDIVNFRHWYFGHFHMDARLSDKFTVLYRDIVPLGE